MSRIYTFLLTPLREGRLVQNDADDWRRGISTHAPAGGATCRCSKSHDRLTISTHAPAGGATLNEAGISVPRTFLLTPLREGRQCSRSQPASRRSYFYSRPCGRGDKLRRIPMMSDVLFLLTPLREGRPKLRMNHDCRLYFYSRPCGRGDPNILAAFPRVDHFYSRPCGRGDLYSVPRAAYSSFHFYSRPCGRGDAISVAPLEYVALFLLTPLREGRPFPASSPMMSMSVLFLLTPLREGRPRRRSWPKPKRNFYSRPCGRGDLTRTSPSLKQRYFYSRPCGRGDPFSRIFCRSPIRFLLTPLREGRPVGIEAEAGGTAIFLLTPLREGRPGVPSECHRRGRFLLTPLREGRQKKWPKVRTGSLFLLTPLREGRRRLPAASYTPYRFLLTPLREGRPRRQL